jgi:hypothetical protein
MGYRVAADLVVIVHALVVLFVVLGGLLVLRWPRVAWLHVPAMVWGILIEWSGGICPLTPLENRLRRLGGERGYAGGFVEHYVIPVLYPEALTPQIQWLLGGSILGVNLVVYGLLWLRRRRRDGDHA